MQGFPTSYWGKLKNDSAGRPIAWHPLEAHSADVAACLEALLERSILRRRLARLAGLSDLSPTHIARLAALAALHDIGKFNHGFQAKAELNPRRVAGHVGEVLAILANYSPESDALLRALGWESMEAWAAPPGGIQPLLLAAIAHHGRPASLEGNGSPSLSLWKAIANRDPIDGVRRLFQQIMHWFPMAFQRDATPFPDSPPFQHAFSGLVTLADWLGSDTSLFRYAEVDDGDRMLLARPQAALAVEKLGLDAALFQVALGTEPVEFSRISPFPPRPPQEELLKLPIPSGGSLDILEAETGAGKTEAALIRFMALLQAGQVDGLYFALPTRTAATQIHGRIVEAVRSAFPDFERRPPVVLAVPGYLSVDDKHGIRLPGFEVLWSDDEKERWRFRGWAAEHPKRYLAGAVVIGTIDQVLLSALAVNHSHMRATALLRHLLVIDEVHASDAYMNRLLEAVLARHLQAGGHALLMSATLGASALEGFLQAASGERPRRMLPSRDEAIRRPYPALTHWQPDTKSLMRPIDSPAQSKRIHIRLEPWAEDPEAIALNALDAARRGARVLILRNTVRDCLATQERLERIAEGTGGEDLLFRCGKLPVPHHSRYAASDRTILDHAIEGAFGKTAPAGRGVVAVATQTVQQSLDLDADLMLTDLCPMDVLLQRLGRLHRHGDRPRPDGFAPPARAIVLVPSERDLTGLIRKGGEAVGDHGFGTVYEDLRVLEATWQELEQRSMLTIPEDNRELVEAATHPEALKQITDTLGASWQLHATKVMGARLANQGIAVLHSSNWSEEFGSGPSLFPDRTQEPRISTRLGEGDRRMNFDPPFAGPFGSSIEALALPAQFSSGAAPDEKPTDLTPTPNGGVRFTFGPRHFVYDRLGLRPAPSAPPSPEDDNADA